MGSGLDQGLEVWSGSSKDADMTMKYIDNPELLPAGIVAVAGAEGVSLSQLHYPHIFTPFRQ